MPRVRTLPPVAELTQELRERGVTDVPADGDEDDLRGLLDTALFLAESDKAISFGGFSWDDPRFVAGDAKVQMGIAYARLHDGEPLHSALLAAVPRVARGTTLLALDARATSLREFDVIHDLYGEVTLFAYPRKPYESADPRVDAARELGWVKTLKEHNLLPGRGIVVLDEHQGLFLKEPLLEGLMGIVLLLPSGMTTLHWNPFVEADRNDSELQYWLQWGRGTGASSEWREVLRFEGDE